MTLRKFSISKHFRAWVFRLEKVVSIVLCKKKKIKIREAVKILLGACLCRLAEWTDEWRCDKNLHKSPQKAKTKDVAPLLAHFTSVHRALGSTSGTTGPCNPSSCAV